MSSTKINKDKASRLFELHCLITDRNPKRNKNHFEASLMSSIDIFLAVEGTIFEFMSSLVPSINRIEDIYELDDEDVLFLIDSGQVEESSHLANRKYLN